MSSDEKQDVEDHDLGSAHELAELFKTQFHIGDEQSVSLKRRYVMQLSQFPKSQMVAVALSEGSVAMYDLTTGKITEAWTVNAKEKNTKITGIKCSPLNDNDLFVCHSSGEVLIYDVRTSEPVRQFWDGKGNMTLSSARKPYSTFDLNSNGRVICVGTEEVKTDVFLCFFDVRQSQMMGGYFETHRTDVTQVKFHPSNPNLLVTGSVDGLINYFDIAELDEDEALQSTLNANQGVCSLNWHKNDLVSCITDINNFFLYDVADTELVAEFNRTTVTERMRRNCSMECNLIDCHNTGENGAHITLMATSNFNNGECLRTLTYDASSAGGKTLRTHGNFSGNRQIVRCSHYNDTHHYFLTGGESGLITLWREGAEPADTTEASAVKTELGKAKKNKAHHNKPY